MDVAPNRHSLGMTDAPLPRGRRRTAVDVRVALNAGQTGPLADPIPTWEHRKKQNFQLRQIEGVLFDGAPRPEDIVQGEVGSCYLLSVIGSAAATHPELIESMITQTGPHTFEVRFFIEDEHGDLKERRVAVDDDFYVNPETDSIVYAQGREVQGGRVLWPMLIEKAAALLPPDDATTAARGSYSAIDGGYEAWTIAALTGKRAKMLRCTPRSEDRIWNALASAVDDRRVIVMGTPGEAGHEVDPEMNQHGLLGGHAYSVLGYRIDGGQRLVTLRNPWASFEPGDIDPEADPNPEDGNEDGVFEKPIEWIVERFSDLHMQPK